jgi:hypothetical protein
MKATSVSSAEMDRPTCWWCGNVADSREHKFKASELRLNNGRGSWSGTGAVVHQGQGDDLDTVRGPKADGLKWSASMCQNCNSTRSQPFDRAYDELIQYVSEQEATLAVTREFRFSDVYGSEWERKRIDLIRYWVKHICCRAVEIDLKVPHALRSYMDDPRDNPTPPHLFLVLGVQVNLLRMALEDGVKGSWFGPAQGWNHDGKLAVIESHVTWGWLRLNYRFNRIDPDCGTSFGGDLVHLLPEEVQITHGE